MYRRINLEEPCCIIAETDVNHNGCLNLARDLVDAAVEANADAVKFQTFHTENLVMKDASPAPYQERSGNTNQYEMLSEIELSEDAFSKLVDYCEKKDIEFLSTPYDRRSVDLLDELGVERFKIASADIVNKPLLERIASKKNR